jgi:uncharacterized protein YihD (DUF1040 family)
MKVTIPEFPTQKETFDYLRANKKKLIAEKCLKPIKHDSTFGVHKVSVSKSHAQKATSPLPVVEIEDGTIEVSIVGNTYNYCDSQMDVLFAGCATKTAKESGPKGKDLIYHLKDHDTCTDDRIGYIQDIYEKDFSLQELGLNMVGNTTCLVFDSLVKEALAGKLYIQYTDKKVKQHSIGLQYVKLFICINDPNDSEHFANWNKYFQFVINKEVITSGYFWAVTEIKLYEVSAVLWGANEITPTLEETEKEIEPTEVTQKQEPLYSTQDTINFIKSRKFFNN